jgi:ABC-type multidrug transport system ATPase subunit
VLTGFLGPNGAGKSTAMRTVFGLVDLDAGAVRWRGAPDSGGRADAMWVRRGRTRSGGESGLRRARQPT